MFDLSKMEKLLNKAKMDLMVKKMPFLSSIIMSMEHVFSEDTPTADVDGVTVRYNPTFFEEFSKEDRIFLMAHECMHVVLMHLARHLGHDPKLWNDAGDYVINSMLVEMGLKMPSCGLYDPMFKDWSTDKVYEFLVDEEKKSGQHRKSDPIGIDLLPPKDPTKQKELQKKVTNILVRATQIAKASRDAGNIPGALKRHIDKLVNPKLDWRSLLYRFMESFNKDDYCRHRPNRRYMPDLYLPTLHSENLNKLTVAMDTSGSVDDKMRQAMLSECRYIYDIFKPSEMTILDCDYKIQNIHKVDDSADIENMQFKGGGGTAFEPVLKYCTENDTNVLIYFTDLYANTPDFSNIDYPILWICYSDHAPAKYGETIYCNTKMETR